METLIKCIGTIVVVFWIIFGISGLVALPVMWVINYLFRSEVIKAMFGTAQLGFWQSFCLCILTGMLFNRSSNAGSK